MTESCSKKNIRNNLWNIWILIVICFILVSGMFAGVYILYPSMVEKEDVGCLTKPCLETAVEIMSSLDATTNPCDDFYEFACGNFIEKDDESNTALPYLAYNMRNLNRLFSIITEPIRGDERKSVLLQKTFYQGCMNVGEIDKDENETFKKLLEQLGGWPVVEGQKWIEDNFQLDKIITKCKNLGFPFQWFFQFSFDENLYKIYINVPKITETNNSSKYVNLMVATAEQLGASRIIATNEMEKVITFEKKLNNIIFRNSQNDILSTNISTLDSVFPRFSWLQFIDNFMKDFNYTEAENYLIDSNIRYLRELNALFANTPNRTQANYIIWKVIHEFGIYLSTPIREHFQNYRNDEKQHLKTYQTSRIECCVKDARIRFSGVAESEFIYRFIDKDKYLNIVNMIEDIKEQFINRLKSADWVDDTIKEAIIDKVKRMVAVIGLKTLEIGYDGALEDFSNLHDLEFTTADIINMSREKNINDFKRFFLSANISSERDISNTLWTLEIDTKYINSANILFLSAGIVQDIFYDENRPNFLNYGALGSIIGGKIADIFSEYAHSLNEEKEIIVALYNENVYGINITLLNMTDTTELTNSSEYEVEMETNFENEINYEILMVKDFIYSIGIDAAYAAYIKWVEENYEEIELPSLPYSALQMFWIQFGTIHCYNKIDDIKWSTMEVTTVSPRHMIINSVQYSENFAKDFKCQEGTQMDP